MIAWFSIAPDDGSGHYGKYVAEVLKVIEASGLKYRLGSMGTEIEGTPDQVWDTLAKCHHRFTTKPHVRRIAMVVKIDDRIGAGEGEMDRKIRSAEGGQ